MKVYKYRNLILIAENKTRAWLCFRKRFSEENLYIDEIKEKNMKTSDRGINFIKNFEKLRLEAYPDPVGIWTIGYGHTGGVKPGDKVTEEEAEKLLRHDLQIAENEINRLDLWLTQNRFDALVSFVFNVGTGNFRSSTLRKKLLENPDDPSIFDEFKRWKYGKVNGKSVVLPGLVKRREAEAKLYMTGKYDN